MRSRFSARPERRPQIEAGALVVSESVAPSITKGQQSGTGYIVQDMKDAGRTALAITLEATASGTAEALQSMTLSASGAATTTFSSRVITNGKFLRFQMLSLTVESLGSGTAPQRAYLRLRSNSAGSTNTSSALQLILAAGTNDAVVNASRTEALMIPDGFELAGNGTRTFGFTLETPDYVASTGEVRVKATILAFEY